METNLLTSRIEHFEKMHENFDMMQSIVDNLIGEIVDDTLYLQKVLSNINSSTMEELCHW